MMPTSHIPPGPDFDLVVYGATPAGIAAAVTAGRAGRSAVLIDSHTRVGGMPASGMTNIDFRTYESVSGIFRELMDGVAGYYRETYGVDSTQYRDCHRGAFFEPKVALSVFERMLAEADVDVRLRTLLVATETDGDGKRIESVELRDLETGERSRLAAPLFIDATYEGDLMAAAGEEYVLGAESRDEYGEPLAAEEPNRHVMAYNYRVVVSRDPANRIAFHRPDGYDANAWPMVVEGFASGRFTALREVIGIHEIPNEKANLNDAHSSDCESFMLFDETDRWPEASHEEREELRRIARLRAEGYFYFLANDERLPAAVRGEMLRWGYAADEFGENDHFPPWLYVREGRRMRGEYVFTQRDGEPEEGSVRAPAHADAVAIGDYNFNSHGTHRDKNGHKLGTLKGKVALPYQVPYGTIVPRRCDNLLVPVAVSASRVGYATLRQAPTWTALGQAAGAAAVEALEAGCAPRAVDVARVQYRLHAAGAKTFYASDVDPGSPYFEAVQFLGNRGFFQQLYPPGEKVRWGGRLSSQHFEAFAKHDVGLDEPLTPELAREWAERAGELFGAEARAAVEEIAVADETRSRKVFIAELYRLACR
jgi:hypothetical protein